MTTEDRNGHVLAELKKKFTMEQQTHWRTVQWLISDVNRRGGRTHLMCVAFIWEALEKPGQRIYVFDHFVKGGSDYRMRQHVLHYIAELLEPFNELKVTYGEDGCWFSIAED